MTRIALGLTTSVALLALAPAAAAATGPSAKTGAATGVTARTASLAGSVNPNGRSTTFFFQFGTSTKYGYGTQASSAGAGKKAVHVTGTLSGLTPDTTYHYRLVALNSAGSSFGGDRSFHTAAIPTEASIAAAPNPVAFGGTIVVSGALTGPPNVGNKEVALYANPFPYTGGFKQVGNTVVTTDTGSYSFTVGSLGESTDFRVVDQSDPSVASPIFHEQVAAVVTLTVRRLDGGRYRFAGTVTPGVHGALVLIKRRSHHRWRTIAKSRARARSLFESVFSHGVRLDRGGRFEAVVVLTGGPDVSGRSAPVAIRLHR